MYIVAVNLIGGANYKVQCSTGVPGEKHRPATSNFDHIMLYQAKLHRTIKECY